MKLYLQSFPLQCIFRSNLIQKCIRKKRNNILLPIILENINSTAVMKLCIDNSMKVTAHLNGDQDTVITCDQPVYILVQQVKILPWKYKKVVPMLGALHIEMVVEEVIGDWLSGSGWHSIFTECGTSRSGRAEKFLTSKSVKRTRGAHEISLFVYLMLLN